MSNERYKLHPVSAVLNFLKGLKELLLPFLFLFIANGFNLDAFTQGSWWDRIPALIGLAALLFVGISGVIKWKRFMYWVDEDELHMQYGLFVKKNRTIPFERIQSLTFTEGILHRPLKLIKVKIETASSNIMDKSEAELTAITLQDAEALERYIEDAKQGKKQVTFHGTDETLENEEKRKPFYQMATKDLLLLATTSGGIGVVFSGIAVFLSQFSELIPYEAIYSELVAFLHFGAIIVITIVFIVLLIGWLLSVLLTLINFHQFTIWRSDHQLTISRGLLEKKKVAVPFERVQGIQLHENPLRQLFGYCTVMIESAGGGLKEEEAKVKLFPLIKTEKAKRLLPELFPTYEWPKEWEHSPTRARAFFFRLDFLWMVPAVAACSYFFFPYGLFSLLLLPVVVGIGIWQHRSTAFATNNKVVAMRTRGISLRTFLIEKRRVQSMELSQSIFARRKSLASIKTTIKSSVLGTKVKLPYMEEKQVVSIMNWFRP
ncbi:hypothetical protein D3873_11185 [Paenisporosarcina cavernae]|uniref:YdbS-like PH domain-containing protein n=1 Tax=Paenisporosarcina cavernae TaxID=2320858 RepID=A0A385YVF5_9BACL|nr:hypothetical protein D3873_11185 [Paenisporosarcina cavernae]